LDLESAVAGEEGGEVAADDLVRWPPERFAGDGACLAVAAVRLAAEVAWRAAGEEESAEDRLESTRLNVGSACAAITSATASACWAAIPPCLIGNWVMSPAA